MRALAVVLAIVLAVPAASAIHSPFGALFPDPEMYEAKTAILGEDHAASVNPAAGTQLSMQFINQPVSSLEVRETTLLVLVSQSVTYPATSTGTWNVSVLIEGQDVECTWFIRSQTGLGFDATTVTPSFLMSCPIHDHPDGLVNLTITRTSEAGTPPAIQAHQLSVVVYRQDMVVTSMPSNFEALTGLSAAEFLIFPLLGFVGLFLWTRQDLGVRLFGVFLVLFDMAIVYAFYASAGGEAWPGLFVMVFVLLLAAAWMVVQLARDAGKARSGGDL